MGGNVCNFRDKDAVDSVEGPMFNPFCYHLEQCRSDPDCDDLNGFTCVFVCVQLQHHAGMLGGQSLRSTYLHQPGGDTGRPAASKSSAGYLTATQKRQNKSHKIGSYKSLSVSSFQQDGKDYIPLGSFMTGGKNHGETMKENPLAVTNLRYMHEKMRRV